jgi:hypothetical protein
MSPVIVVVLLLAYASFQAMAAPARCIRGQACWPSDADVAALSAALDPTIERRLWWSGPPAPYPCAEPVSDESHQPLYGAGQKLQPVRCRLLFLIFALVLFRLQLQPS